MIAGIFTPAVNHFKWPARLKCLNGKFRRLPYAAAIAGYNLTVFYNCVLVGDNRKGRIVFRESETKFDTGNTAARTLAEWGALVIIVLAVVMGQLLLMRFRFNAFIINITAWNCSQSQNVN
ncbi:hypothetical protein DM790_17245 [Flavobacterium collinsii]|nr:hypothetical protein [Flavobacterium collinsii]